MDANARHSSCCQDRAFFAATRMMSDGAHRASWGPSCTRCWCSALATIQSPLLTIPNGSSDAFSSTRSPDKNFLTGRSNVSAPASWTRYSSSKLRAGQDSSLGLTLLHQ